MKFCVLSPIAGLERYATLSQTHLLLPQLDKLKGYRDFYVKQQQAGDFIILDNGAYEGQTDWKHLLDCIEIYHPNVCALPDYLLQDWKKTLHSSMEFLDRWYDAYPDLAWMYIPQAEPRDLIGYVDSLYHALDDERVSWIGLARAMAYGITEDPFIRAKIAEGIRKRYPRIKLHALGMVKGNVDELNSLKDLVHSIDSNAPVWRGWCGRKLTDPWDEKPIYYEGRLETEYYNADAIILDNLDTVGVNTSPRRNQWPNQ